MNFRARFGKHLVAIGASMAGGALAGGAIVFAFTAVSPPVTNGSRVAEVVSPSPSEEPSPEPSPSESPSPTAAPTAAPTSAPTAAPTQAPPPPPPPARSPTCPTGKVLLAQSGSGRWDGAFTVPAICATYTYHWSYGPVPGNCTSWTLAFYPDVNDQGHEYTQAGPTSGDGSQARHNPGSRIQSEVNLYNGCAAIPWSIQVTAG